VKKKKKKNLFFVLCSQNKDKNKNNNKQLKTQNTFKNIKIIFTSVSHQNAFSKKRRRKESPKT
jgi:septum formation inhibitor-activating ATPase MinD